MSPDRIRVALCGNKFFTEECNLIVTAPNKKEADNKVSRRGFFTVARGLGVPSLDKVVVGQMPVGSVLYSLEYRQKELIISRLEQGHPVLEGDAKVLDFLWERVNRLVRSMMIDHKAFEATFCRIGDEVSAVNFVAK